MTLGEDADGPAVVPDPDGTAPGRGAHLHPTPACLALAERRRAFARALRYEGGKALGLEAVREYVARPEIHTEIDPEIHRATDQD